MNKKNNILISIIIPVYNGSNYLREAIDSALAQTYQDIEIIVINDGSNDNGKTKKIALSYGDKIKYFEKENGGVSTALNFGIKKMTGDYFSWLSHDDVYLSNKIEEQVNYLMEHDLQNEKVILFSDYSLIDEKSKIISECIKPHEEIASKPEYSLLRGHINGITLLIPKKAFEEHGNFDENLRAAQDYMLWYKMFKTYKIIHIPTIIAKSRYHAKQVSKVSSKVKVEGNELFIFMIEDLTDSDKIRLEGSIYRFYKEMALFLKETPYDIALEHCENKCKEIVEEIKKKKINSKVSVIIPTYNREVETLRAIDSVLNQSYSNVELIVIDDNSNIDDDKLRKKLKTLKNAKYIKIKENKGPANARNIGIQESTGDYIAFLDSDDEFIKDKIKKQLEAMILMESNVSHTSYIRRMNKEERTIKSGLDSGKIERKLMYSCQIATPTVMIKKEFLTKNNYEFNSSLRIGEDTCFWLTILKNEYLLGIDDPLTIVNSNNDSSAYDTGKQIMGFKTIISFLLNDDYYNKFDQEIANICSSYTNYVDMKYGNQSRKSTGNYYRRLKISIKTTGFKETFKKIFKKFKSKITG